MCNQKNKKLNQHISQGTVKRNDEYQIRQNSHYNKQNKASPDNNLFWEKRSNPLSSKGN